MMSNLKAVAEVNDFENIDMHLLQSGSHIGAAEAHGLQSGMICGEQCCGSFDWQAALMNELDCVSLVPKLQQQLEELHKKTKEQLQDSSFNFGLLLPNDDNDLQDRTEALANWCRGFICGLGLAGLRQETLQSKYAKEALEDLSKIAHVCAQVLETETEERAFSELVEYVRIAVQTIQLELNIQLVDTKGKLH